MRKARTPKPTVGKLRNLYICHSDTDHIFDFRMIKSEVRILGRFGAGEDPKELLEHLKDQNLDYVFYFGDSEQTTPAISAPEPIEPLPPPKIVKDLIWLVLPRRVRDAVLGDAEEAYRQSLAEGYSYRAASFDYAKEAVFAILFSLWSPVLRLLASFRKSS
jgi:hypothetical protein